MNVKIAMAISNQFSSPRWRSDLQIMRASIINHSMSQNTERERDSATDFSTDQRSIRCQFNHTGSLTILNKTEGNQATRTEDLKRFYCGWKWKEKSSLSLFFLYRPTFLSRGKPSYLEQRNEIGEEKRDYSRRNKEKVQARRNLVDECQEILASLVHWCQCRSRRSLMIIKLKFLDTAFSCRLMMMDERATER